MAGTQKLVSKAELRGWFRFFQKVAPLVLLGCAGCHSSPPPSVSKVQSQGQSFVVTSVVDPARAAASPVVSAVSVQFRDVSRNAGLHWAFNNGATGRHLFVESTGGGVATFDCNNDGLLDIFAIQGGPVPGARGKELQFSRRNVLYRNNGDGTFADVTVGSGLDAPTGYGQGVSSADYDNDGKEDLYITAYGGNHLFHNEGNGKFKDVTRAVGVMDTATETPWPLSSAWADYDRDGFLDLFVCHYCRWSPALDQPCKDASGRLLYCRPQVYESSPSRLYHNNGHGGFTDVTHSAGIDKALGKSMGVAWSDYDEDGWPDIFVSNDTSPNFLWHNNHKGGFSNEGLVSGVAVSSAGAPASGMGVAPGDYDRDGREDLAVVNFSEQPKSLFHNEGHGLFGDAAFKSNLASTNLRFLGFGLDWCDYDLDGLPDLIVGNGHVVDWSASESNGSTYAQSQQLLHNSGGGLFVDDQRSLGDLVKPRVTRGIAVGDYDNDGAPDVVMVAQNGPLQLFRNNGGNANRWISLRLEGTRCNRDAIGAKVMIKTADGTQTQWVHGGSSYCSQSDRRVVFGLGKSATMQSLTIVWPDGLRQQLKPLATNHFYWAKEGQVPVLEPRHQ